MEKRLLIAVTLSILVMLVYPLLMPKTPSPITQPLSSSQPVENTDSYNTKDTVRNTAVAEVEPSSPTLPADAISKIFTSTKYEIDMANIGASINKIIIRDGKRFDADLVEDAFYKTGILAIDGKGALSGLSSQPFIFKKDTNSFYVEKNGVAIEKTIKFLKDRYGIVASVKITNRSGATQFLSFDITTASNISTKEIYESRYMGADILDGAGRFKRIAGGNFKKDKRLYQNDIQWLALRNKYYSIIAKPLFTPSGVFTTNVGKRPVTGFMVDDVKILPGETQKFDLLFYVGPTDIEELEKVDPLFGKALNFGKLTSISLVLLSVLRFFYGLFHNYGVAILLLTCCISFALFPLSLKSLKSMRKMQELQPHIEKVRADHKDNPHKLNKEIMELYRRYNVNPMGGCLPMLLQMPIFIALYQTLMRSVELKGATFLWIKDLSMPDQAFHLPFTLPFLGNAVNLLPILMIGAMIFQQKLSQGSSKAAKTDQQKMMATVMPVMFGFLFYSLPAGLVLYWLTNTLMTSSLQYFALRKA